MFFSNLFLLLAATASLSATASPTTFSGPSFHRRGAQNGTEDACTKVSQIYQESVRNNVTQPLLLPGELALGCLQALPFDQDMAAQMVVELKKYLEFHSTTEMLKNPPNGYLSPPTDLWGGMDYIHQQVLMGEYKSQYEFDDAVFRLWSSANDGHLGVELCSQSIFLFKSSLNLVSVSEDGLQLPQIYAFEDARILKESPESVSPVVLINGQDVIAHLEERSLLTSFHDPDARYNQMFPNFARTVSQSPDQLFDLFTVSRSWPGQYASLTVQFKNGTVVVVPISATITSGPKFDYDNGPAVWTALCLPQKQSADSSNVSQSSSSGSVGVAAPTVYPKPVVRDDFNLISGYFLDDEQFDDVAVLFIPSFLASQPGEPLAFSQHTTAFLEKSIEAGKKRLIIDLTNNGGGLTNKGYDLFQALFPGKFMYSSTRFRDHEALRLMLEAFRNVAPDTPLYQNVSYLFSSPCFLQPDQKTHFSSWEELYGPHELMGANLTSPFAVFDFNLASTSVSPIRGFGPEGLNVTTPAFAPEDILVITDGACSSTCAIFVQLMKEIGVKIVTFGGRPQYGPMASVGGTTGAQAFDLSFFDAFAEGIPEVFAEVASSGQQPLLSSEDEKRLLATYPPLSDTLPLILHAVSVNLKNSYRPGNQEDPLQFQYDPADCRLFYTAENVMNPASVWTSAANTLWGNSSCIQGSTNARAW